MCGYVWGIAAWFGALNPAWVGALIGLSGSILVVIATNWGNSNRLDKQLKTEGERQQQRLDAENVRLRLEQKHDLSKLAVQLNHDAEQRREDHKATIRREVYIDGVKQSVAAIAHIASLPRMKLEEGVNPGLGLQPFLEAAAQVRTVSDIGTAVVVSELTAVLMEFFFKATKNAGLLRRYFIPIETVNEQISYGVAEARRIDIEISLAKEASKSADQIAVLHASLSRMQEWIKVLLQQRVDLWKVATPHLIQYQVFMQEDGAATQEMMVKAISALRKELHLDPGEEELLAILADARKRVLAVMDEILKPLLSPTEEKPAGE